MNDNLGHAAGDAYLFGFANILKECFQGSAVVSRTGGDEFVVITRNDDEVKVTKRLTKLVNLANANVDENGNPFIISFAYGYAISTEANFINVDNAYKIADKRMYECKSRQKIMANKEMEETINENQLEVRESE
jgi:diguanylate cyclase (GGDEF)-like protein